MYIQIDIEGYEFSSGGFKNWIDSGALKNINQIAIELHVEESDSNRYIYCLIILPNNFNDPYNRQYIELVSILQDLHSIGFRLISQEPNMVKGPGNDGIYNFIEVVFMKT